MKLYEIPRGSKIEVELTDGVSEYDGVVTFHRLDGAFSYCTIDKTGDVVHISASQELELLANGNYCLE